MKGALKLFSFLLQDRPSMTREHSMEVMFNAAEAVAPRLTDWDFGASNTTAKVA